MAGATAFFHRGLCPLCGGGFRRCRFETLLFTPTEERRLWRGKDCKKGTPVNPGCFCFSRECGGFTCVGAVLGKRGSGILTRLTGNARELLPAGAPPVNLGCFCFSGKYGGESACVGAVLGKRCSGIVTQLTGDVRELLPAGAVQPVSAGFLKSVPPCGTPKLFAFHYSLFTDFQPSHSMI